MKPRELSYRLNRANAARATPMGAINRRVFLMRSSMAVAAAGVATAIPGLVPALTVAETEAPEADAAVAGESTATMADPLVAHVRDLATGEISLFSGTQEVVIHDPGLANRLFTATH